MSRPNYFIGIRLHRLQDQVEQLNQELVSAHDEIKHYLTSTQRLHITSFVLALPDEERALAAAQLFDECKDSIQEMFRHDERHTVQFSKLNSFPGSVLYLEPSESETMHKLSAVTALMRDKFSAAGFISLTDRDQSWTPHLTVAKKSKNFKRKIKGQHIFNSEAYDAVARVKGLLDSPLQSDLTVVEFLSMAGSGTAETDALGMDGYYRSLSTIKIAK